MTTLPLICIIILMIVALNFIWETYHSQKEQQNLWDNYWSAEDEIIKLSHKLDKYIRDRDSRGRFIKGGS